MPFLRRVGCSACLEFESSTLAVIADFVGSIQYSRQRVVPHQMLDTEANFPFELYMLQ